MAYIVVGVGAMQGGNIVASVFGNISCSITLGKILSKATLARTLRSYDAYFEQINFVYLTPLRFVYSLLLFLTCLLSYSLREASLHEVLYSA